MKQQVESESKRRISNSLGCVFCIIVTAQWTIKLELLGKIKHNIYCMQITLMIVVFSTTTMSDKDLGVCKYKDLYVKGTNTERHGMMR